MPLREPKPLWKVEKDGPKAKLEVLLNGLGELHQFIDLETAERTRSHLAPMLPDISKEDMRKAPRLSLRKAAATSPNDASRAREIRGTS